MLLGLAHAIGWRPVDFWAASLWELSAAIAAALEAAHPKKPEMSDAEVKDFLGAAVQRFARKKAA